MGTSGCRAGRGGRSGGAGRGWRGWRGSTYVVAFRRGNPSRVDEWVGSPPVGLGAKGGGGGGNRVPFPSSLVIIHRVYLQMVPV